LVAGGVIVFVGSAIAGGLIISSTPGYPNEQSDQQAELGVGVAVAGACVGIALLVPGVMKLTKASDEEKLAIERYGASKDPAPPPAGPAPPTKPSALTMTVPIVSLTF
jgi:hypothetical protein